MLVQQNFETNSAMLAPQGATQTYAELMQQMTVLSPLQNDNMCFPITSFTSLLNAGMNDEVRDITKTCILAFSMKLYADINKIAPQCLMIEPLTSKN